MEQARAQAKQRGRKERTGQGELFPAEEMPISRPIDLLRLRQMRMAKRDVAELLTTGQGISYEQVWDLALSYSLVWGSDLKNWIKSWKEEGKLRIEGMKPKQRVPALDSGNVLYWQIAGHKEASN
jgi:hypothetical protein